MKFAGVLEGRSRCVGITFREAGINEEATSMSDNSTLQLGQVSQCSSYLKLLAEEIAKPTKRSVYERSQLILHFELRELWL